MLNMKNPNHGSRNNYRPGGGNDGLTFMNHGKASGDDDDEGEKPWHSEMTCYHCGEKGHIAKHCPKKKKIRKKGSKGTQPMPLEEGVVRRMPTRWQRVLLV